MSGSPQWSLFLGFLHQNPVHPISSPIRTTCPAHLILLDFTTRIIFGKEYRSLSSSICNFLHSPVTSSLLGPNTLLNTLFSNTLSLRSSLNVSDQVSHPNRTTGTAFGVSNWVWSKKLSMRPPRPDWGCHNTAKKGGLGKCGRQGIQTEFGLG